MNYSDWINAVCTLLEYQVNDATSATPTNEDSFNTIYPRAIDYTENRLQRDLDFIQTSITTSTGVMTPNSRTITYPSVDLPAVANLPVLIGNPIPAGSIVSTTIGIDIVNVMWTAHGQPAGSDVAILTPLFVGGLTLGGVYQIITVVDANNFTLNVTFNAVFTDSESILGSGIYIVVEQIRPIVGGTRMQPLEPVTRPYLDFAWPDENSPGANILPVQWCPKDQTTALVGPAPDQAYGFEVVGTMRIPQLSAANYTNFLTQQFADLYVAASMVFFSGYQRDFSAQAEDPKMAQSWENQYQLLLSSAKVEEARKQFANMFPSPSRPTGLTAQSQG